MKRTVGFCFAFVATMLFVGCGTTKDVVQDEAIESFITDFEVLHTDILAGGGSEGIEEGVIVCNSEEELNNLKRRMNSVNNATEFLKDVSIDFKKETIIAYFQPVRSSGGYVLEADFLAGVVKDGNLSYELQCTVETPKGATITILTQPFIFVKTRKIKEPVSYKIVEK